jgi:hypothetical protein
MISKLKFNEMPRKTSIKYFSFLPFLKREIRPHSNERERIVKKRELGIKYF